MRSGICFLKERSERGGRACRVVKISILSAKKAISPYISQLHSPRPTPPPFSFPHGQTPAPAPIPSKNLCVGGTSQLSKFATDTLLTYSTGLKSANLLTLD